MYNYNIIKPANIYRGYEPSQNTKALNQEEKSKQTLSSDEDKNDRRFPNGNKVAIDYTKNQINIAQVLQDFRSTIAAINSPDEVKEDVEAYLSLVDKESKKDYPSREIILSDLKNAARITDKYIEDSLKKPSSVVQKWVSALFEQNINLKSNPNEINEAYRVKIPDNKQKTQDTKKVTYSEIENKETIQEEKKSPDIDTNSAIIANSKSSLDNLDKTTDTKDAAEEVTGKLENIETTDTKKSIYSPRTEKEILAKEAYELAKESIEDNGDVYKALKMYDRAVGLLEDSTNKNLQSAIYYERGKIFDSFDFPELALVDYHRATNSDDGNLRAQAYIKMGNIYDDYIQIEPALNQYSRAIESSEDANNPYGKTRALRYIASMFAGIYDTEGTENFNELAIEAAKETYNPSTIAKTYLEAAKNYQYVGEDKKALETYKNLAKEDSLQEDYSTLASNYKEASNLMAKKGNMKKSLALLDKANEFEKLAKLQEENAA